MVAAGRWPLARRLACLQAALGFACGVLLVPWGGWTWWLAATAGGGVQALLTLYFAARFFAASPGDAVGAVRAFYRAEVGKWLGAVIVFGLAARYRPSLFPPLLAGYAAGLLGNWLALLWSPYQPRRLRRKRI